MSAPASQRVGWCPGALRPMESGDGFLLRIKPRGGLIDFDRAETIGALSLRYGNGLIDVTGRANLQIRGVSSAAIQPLTDALATLGLLDASPEVEAIRNIVASPLAGLDPTARCDIGPLVAAIAERFARDPSLHALPAKWSVVVDDGGALPLSDVSADLRFACVSETEVHVSLGTAPERGLCLPGEVAEVAATFARFALAGLQPRRMQSLVEAQGAAALFARANLAVVPSPFAAFSTSSDGGRPSLPGTGRVAPEGRRVGSSGQPPSSPARSREPVSLSSEDVAGPGEPHLSSFGCHPPRPGEGWAPGMGEEGGALALRGNRTAVAVAGLIGWHSQDFVFFGIAPPFASLDAQDLIRLARAARDAGARDLRLTPWRVILVTGVTAETAVAFAAALRETALIVDPADPRLAISACVGHPACRRGTVSTRADAVQLAASLPAQVENPLIHLSGCSKGCAQGTSTPWTLVGREGRYDLIRNGRVDDTPVARGLSIGDAASWISQAPGTRIL